jgi:hypothetical protein
VDQHLFSSLHASPKHFSPGWSNILNTRAGSVNQTKSDIEVVELDHGTNLRVDVKRSKEKHILYFSILICSRLSPDMAMILFKT